MISRRRFLTTTGAAVLAAPLAAEAQATKVMRIGWLWDGSVGPPLPGLREAFWQALQERGWVEGRNFVIESRSAENRGLTNEQRDEVLKRMAAELVASHVDVIVAFPAGAALAAKKVTEVVPIVFAGVSDPVGFGLVASLARPGGNVTGLSYLGLELNPKRLHLLKEAFPKATRIGVLVPALHPLRQRMVKDIEAAAQALNVRLHFMVVAASDPPDHIDRAFAAMAHERVDAVLGLQGPHYFRERRRIADLALKYKLPGIFELAAYAEVGCLMAYAPSFSDLYRRAATYVDKILKGAKPADLPVEQPTTFELVINLKTAKALGLTIPPSLLLRADQVIE